MGYFESLGFTARIGCSPRGTQTALLNALSVRLRSGFEIKHGKMMRNWLLYWSNSWPSTMTGLTEDWPFPAFLLTSSPTASGSSSFHHVVDHYNLGRFPSHLVCDDAQYRQDSAFQIKIA